MILSSETPRKALGQVPSKVLVSVASAGVEQETFEGVWACGLSSQGAGTGHSRLREADCRLTVGRPEREGAAGAHFLFLPFPSS